MKDSGRFYLTHKQSFLQIDEIWYTRNPVGKNVISDIMEALLANAISNIMEALLTGSFLENYYKDSQITV